MASKTTRTVKDVIKQDQWKMPVSFDTAGQPVSLHDYVQGDHNTLSFSSLSDDQRTELAAKRIEMQPNYEIGAIGPGIVTKDRAVDEVRTKTKLGKRLAQIEARVVLHLIDVAKKGSDSTRG
jgi:hypothetical protein